MGPQGATGPTGSTGTDRPNFTNVITPPTTLFLPLTVPTGAPVSYNTGVSVSSHPYIWVNGIDPGGLPGQPSPLVQELYLTQSSGNWVITAWLWTYSGANVTFYYSYL
jgi:hypothetical protein